MFEENYYPETFMTLEVVDQILSEFKWPYPYELEDDLPDGIIVSFPKCSLLFSEYAEGNVSVKFLDTNEIYPYTLSIEDALIAIKSQLKSDVPPILNSELIPFASLKKVNIEINNQCILLEHYLLECIKGDFSWVDIHRKLN